MRKRCFACFVLVAVLAGPVTAYGEVSEMPGPHDTRAASRAGRDAGPPPGSSTTSASGATAAATTGGSYRVFATQYHPNKSGSVEVAIPDKCAKFASLRWTSALDSHKCPSGYRLDLDWRVLVRRESGESLRIRVKDVGPWNVDDNYWNGRGGARPRRLFSDLARGKPEAQAAFYDGYNTVPNCKTLSGSPSGRSGPADQFGRCVLNPAGIDLSVAAAAKLGLGHLQNGWVTVTFLWERTKSPQSHVLWHHTTKGKVTRWAMSGTTKKRSARIVLPGGARFPRTKWVPVATGDFNRDGRPDLLWWKQGSDFLRVWFMKGNRRIGQTRIDAKGATMGPPWRPVGTGDFDRDGRVDVAWHNADTGRVAIWYLKRTTRQRSATVDRSGEAWPANEWTPFATKDFDDDGSPDIAWHNRSTGHVMLWYLSGADGSRRSSSTVLTRASDIGWPSPSTWVPVGAGHFAGDDTPDLLWRNTSNGALDVWTMGGSDGSHASGASRVSASRFPPPKKVPIVWG